MKPPMPIPFQLTVDNQAQDVCPLRLCANLPLPPEHLCEQLCRWLSSITQCSQLQPEQGADWIQIRFYFQMQPFCLHYEHYSDCYWIDADSQASLVLLSQLAELITSIEDNHRLSRPASS